MVNTNPSNNFLSSKYFIFTQERFNHTYYGVAGREISLQNAIQFPTHKEAQHYADNLNSLIPSQNKTSN